MAFTVRTFDSSGSFIDELTNLVSVEFSIGPNGPEMAVATVARVVDGMLNPQLHHTRLVPGGKAAFVEIVDDEFPYAFLGRLKHLPQSTGDAAVSLDVTGPHAWLQLAPLDVRAPETGSAGHLVQRAINRQPADVRLEIGRIHAGTPVSIGGDGGSLWDLIASVQTETGERAFMTPMPCRARLRFDWLSAEPTQDLRGAVQLIEGENVEVDYDTEFDQTPGPAEPTNVDDLGPVSVAERNTIMVNARITDSALWPKLRIGALVSTRFNDVMGLFTEAEAVVEQITYGVAPERSVDAVLRLWRTS